MDINSGRGRELLRQLLGEPGLQQPAQPPGDDVDRWTISAAVATWRKVIGRHTWLVSTDGSGLTDFDQIR